jgi:hypothetical protein
MEQIVDGKIQATLDELYNGKHISDIDFKENVINWLKNRNLYTVDSKKRRKEKENDPEEVTTETLPHESRCEAQAKKHKTEAISFYTSISNSIDALLENFTLPPLIGLTVGSLHSLDYRCRFEEVVRLNWELGIRALTASLKGRVCEYVHLMHLWCEVNLIDGKYLGKTGMSANIDRIAVAIGDPKVSRESIKTRQRNGGKLIALVQMFGWHTLLFGELTLQKIRDIPVFAIMGSKRYLEGDNPKDFNDDMALVNQRLASDDVVNWVIQAVAEMSGNPRFATVVIDEIKSVKFTVFE